MSIDEETKAAIHTVAKAKVAEALGGDVLGRLIDEVMQHKDRSTYGKANALTFFDMIVREVLEETLRREVRAAIGNDETVKSKVREAIQARAETFAVTVMDAFASDDWRAKLEVVIRDKDR